MDGLRRISCGTIINCRDLGGYLCKDGCVTQFGRLFRFGMPKTPPEEDIQTFLQYGIRCIFDLRSTIEINKHPSPFSAHAAFHYRNIPLYEVNPTFVVNSRKLWNIYRHSVDRYQSQYVAVMRGLLAVKAPAAFHCHAGKDRTGILAALLLFLAGVEKEDIIADYQVSETYLTAYYQQQPKKRFDPFGKEKYLTSAPELMERLFVYLHEKYGGVHGYMQTIGLSQQEITSLEMLLK